MSTTSMTVEQKLWIMADNLKGSLAESEFKHVVLGLLFLKFVTDSFDVRYEKLQGDTSENPEDKTVYMDENVYWVPEAARWKFLKENVDKPEIGEIIDHAMRLIEEENESLRGVFPIEYSKVDMKTLKRLIELVSHEMEKVELSRVFA